MQRLFILPFVLITFLFAVSPSFAQVIDNSNLISFEYPEYKQPPGTQYFVKVSVFLDPQYIIRPQVITTTSYPPAKCRDCQITIKLENKQESDSISQNDTKTDNDGRVSAKIISNIYGKRLVYAEVLMSNGKTYVSKKYALNYFEENEMIVTAAPVPVTTGTEEKPIFRVPEIPKIPGIPGIPGIPVPIITEKLRPEPSQIPILITASQPYPTPISPSKMPVYPFPEVTSTISRPYSEIDMLNKKIIDLQKQLDESKKIQSALEKRIDDLFNMIKRFFPLKR